MSTKAENKPYEMDDEAAGESEQPAEASVGGELDSPATSTLKKRRAAGLPLIDVNRVEEVKKFLSPLTKDQLLDLLSRAACTHEDVFVSAKNVAEESPAARRLMVRNISFATENSSLHSLFSQFGAIEDSTICRDRMGKSKGFGFITFDGVSAVEQALKATVVLDGRNLIVKLASDSQNDTDRATAGSGNLPPGLVTDTKYRRKVFVRNLSDLTTSNRLRETFLQFGPMEDCVVVHDPSTGKSKGYGFVTFSNQDDAALAIQQPQRVIDGQMTFVAYAAPGNREKPDSGMRVMRQQQLFQLDPMAYQQYAMQLQQQQMVQPHARSPPPTFSTPRL